MKGIRILLGTHFPIYTICKESPAHNAVVVFFTLTIQRYEHISQTCYYYYHHQVTKLIEVNVNT